MGSPWATPKTKNNFFSEIIKADPKLSKPFYFNKIPYVLAELCFSILCNAFLLKSAISSHNSCVLFSEERACVWKFHKARRRRVN